MRMEIRLFPPHGALDENEPCYLRLEGALGTFDLEEYRRQDFLWSVYDISNLADDVLRFLENSRAQSTSFEPVEAKFILAFQRQKHGIRVSVDAFVIDILGEATLSSNLVTFLEHVDAVLVCQIVRTERNEEELYLFANLLERARTVCRRFNPSQIGGDQ